MADTPLILPSGHDPKIKSAETAKTKATSSEGPAFHVLLERLQARAQELEQSSADVTDPKRLAGAVDTARASLEDALSLSDQILEAFREVQQQSGAPADSTPDSAEEKR